MRIRQQVVVTCAALICVGLLQPGFARAAACQTLPGRSGVDQYCETLPGATGEQTAGARHGGSQGGHQLSARTRAQLARAGQTGREVAALAATGPAQNGADGGGGRSGSAGAGSGKDGLADRTTPAARSDANTGASAGSEFVWAVAAAALLVALIALARRRLRRSG